MEQIELYNLIIYNDLLEAELHSIPINKFLDNDLRCKLRNAIKATQSLSNKFAEMFENQKQDIEYFGKLADNIKKSIDDYLKKEIKIDTENCNNDLK